jgi:2-oxoglutarate dehydrogenase E2 component (dihydrolipoamide succinyltransferase)
MPTNVVMPQMGESIAEGTIVRWIKKVGDSIDRDEPLFEISTDKVDAEIPAPSAGVLTEIRVREGDTVPVDSVVAVISLPGEAAGAAAGEMASVPEAAGASPAAVSGHDGGATAARPGTGLMDDVSEAGPADDSVEGPGDDSGRRRSSPLVRRIAAEHQVDLDAIQGTGIGGRVTKQDILRHLEARGAAPAPAAEHPRAWAEASAKPAFRSGEAVEVVPMSVMRRKIAEHMTLSLRTSAHVHSVFEVDFTRVAKIRESRKAEFERAGAKLTYLAFIARAVTEALRAWPIVNASIDDANVAYRKEINLGIAVALDSGLIVPVIRHADEKNLLGLSRAIADVAERARSRQLKPEDVQGGTFTITNPGMFGALFGMPIINQPQVAILGVGAVEKRPVVIDEGIAVRLRAYLTLGFDHRLIDGAVADQFMARVKQHLETFDPAAL